MTRNTLLAVAAIALASSSILSAGDVFNGVTPRTATLASDRRTEMQRLQDQVDEMAFLLGEALFAIDDQQSESAATQTELDANQVYVDELKRMITVSGTRLTLRASRITLDSELTVANGELECDLLTTEAVDSESYTPGAGNVW